MISPKSSCAPEHSPIRIGKHLEGRVIYNCPIFPKLRSIQDQAFEIFGNCRGFLRGPALDFGEIHDNLRPARPWVILTRFLSHLRLDLLATFGSIRHTNGYACIFEAELGRR
ncbi:MAG: hypothetical protein RLZZ396_381 [Planctomycetota bacterium]